MTKKHIILLMLLSMPLLLASCLKDQEDTFSESASERSKKYIANAERVLTSSSEGWLLQYYPDREQSYGGYVYTLKFADGKVVVRSEIADTPADSVVSLYTVNNENGPVISFDTYNSLMHHFSTPTGSSGAGGYEAYDGDFIFIIMNISDDENTITLKGGRSGNMMYMTRLTTSGEEYLDSINNIAFEIKWPKYVAVVGEDTVNVSYDKGRTFSFTYKENGEEKTVEASGISTLAGINFYEPVTVLGREIKGLAYTGNPDTFPATGAEDILFKGYTESVNKMFAEGLWSTSFSNLGAFGQDYWQYFADRLLPWFQQYYPGILSIFDFGNFDGSFGAVYLITDEDFLGFNGFDYELIGTDKIKMSHNSNLDDNTGYALFSNVGIMPALLAPFGCDDQGNSVERTFLITVDNDRFPETVTLTDRTTRGNTIVLHKNDIYDPLNN